MPRSFKFNRCKMNDTSMRNGLHATQLMHYCNVHEVSTNQPHIDCWSDRLYKRSLSRFQKYRNAFGDLLRFRLHCTHTSKAYAVQILNYIHVCFSPASAFSVAAQTADLKQRFRGLLLNLRQYLKNYVDLAAFKANILQLRALRSFETPMLHDIRRDILDAASSQDILQILSMYWNYLDYGLLEEIIRRFGSTSLHHKMDGYTLDVTSFKSQCKLTEFLKILEKRDITPLGFSTIQIELSKDPNSCTVSQIDIQLVIANTLSLLPYAILLWSIELQPFTITLLLPSCILAQVREYLRTPSTKNLKLIEDLGIKSLAINNEVTYGSFNSALYQEMVLKLSEKPSSILHSGNSIKTFDYTLVEDPSEEYICPISKELLLEAFTTECCGLHISKNAVEQLKSSGQPCSDCGTTPVVAFPDRSFQREVKDLLVKCKHFELGCEWRGPLVDLKDHCRSSDPQTGCRYECNPCSKCNAAVRRYQMEEHQLEECTKRVSCCELCDYTSTYEDVTGVHQPSCRSHQVRCPNGCPEEVTKAHLNCCPLQVVDCEYKIAGCTSQHLRKDQPVHMENSMQEHLLLLKKRLETLEARFNLAPLEQLPVMVPEFTIHYTKEQASNSWFSPPFYTHVGGYRMCLRVDISGFDQGAGTHLSVYIHLMRGIFDGGLKFPFRGEVTVQLVNQIEDGRPGRGNAERTLVFNENSDGHHGRRVIGPSETQLYGWGVDKLVSHNELEPSAETKYVTEVSSGLKCLKFRITKTVVYSL